MFMHNVQALSNATRTPAVIAGDFGATGDSDLMKFVNDGFVNYFNKKASTFSGQLDTHPSTKKMATPPITEDLAIDYRTCGSWTGKGEVGSQEHRSNYLIDELGAEPLKNEDSHHTKSAAENQEFRRGNNTKKG